MANTVGRTDAKIIQTGGYGCEVINTNRIYLTISDL
jgi:hypothetical protein